MSGKACIEKFIEVRDVILFTMFATKPVTADIIAEYVTGTAPATTRRLLRAMVENKILTTYKHGRTTAYQVSEDTCKVFNYTGKSQNSEVVV